VRRLLTGFLVFVLLSAALAAVLWSLLTTPPTWYRPPDPADGAVARLADQVEHRMLEEVHRIRPETERWTLRVRETHVNAWLAAKLPDWIAHEHGAAWPEDLGTPQIRFREGWVDLAVAVSTDDDRRTVVVRLEPTVEAARLHLRLARVGVGRLALPGRPITALLDRVAAAVAAVGEAGEPSWAELVDGESRPLPEVSLADDRVVRLIDVACRDGAIDLTWETTADR
jgi:hypothetical protein